ncbi:uncharacterized protein [Hemitrygon akajei]|uniref:uncharacterized protein n=1 Tax=Hemitrygon akajei TaxID=2704970 RepID=UPI003BF9BBA8
MAGVRGITMVGNAWNTWCDQCPPFTAEQAVWWDPAVQSQVLWTCHRCRTNSAIDAIRGLEPGAVPLPPTPPGERRVPSSAQGPGAHSLRSPCPFLPPPGEGMRPAPTASACRRTRPRLGSYPRPGAQPAPRLPAGGRAAPAAPRAPSGGGASSSHSVAAPELHAPPLLVAESEPEIIPGQYPPTPQQRVSPSGANPDLRTVRPRPEAAGNRLRLPGARLLSGKTADQRDRDKYTVLDSWNEDLRS